MAQLFNLLLYQPLFNILIFLANIIPGHSIGFAIILLTILIRIILIPSAAQSIKQQRKMKLLQPELKALQELYKTDQQKLLSETMALYKKHDAHPVSSCLPLILQLIIIIPLVYIFQAGLSTERFDLLYPFIDRPDAINTLFFGIDLAKPHIYILPLLAGLLQFVQSWMLLKDPRLNQAKGSEDQTQRILNAQLLYFMPIITIVISLRLPAALPLYWVTSTLFAIIQQYYMFKDVPVLPGQVAAIAAGPNLPLPLQTERHGSVSVTVRKKR